MREREEFTLCDPRKKTIGSLGRIRIRCYKEIHTAGDPDRKKGGPGFCQPTKKKTLLPPCCTGGKEPVRASAQRNRGGGTCTHLPFLTRRKTGKKRFGVEESIEEGNRAT